MRKYLEEAYEEGLREAEELALRELLAGGVSGVEDLEGRVLMLEEEVRKLSERVKRVEGGG